MEDHFNYGTSKEVYLIYNNSNNLWQSNTVENSEEQSLDNLFSLNTNSTYFDLDYDLYYKGLDPVSTLTTTALSTTEDVGGEKSTSPSDVLFTKDHLNNYWALLALILVIGTAAGNILVCLAIAWERRLQNVTNYFLMSLAITDLMVAVLVMPLGILTLVKGK